jgi:hypothetical protein
MLETLSAHSHIETVVRVIEVLTIAHQIHMLPWCNIHTHIFSRSKEVSHCAVDVQAPHLEHCHISESFRDFALQVLEEVTLL